MTRGGRRAQEAPGPRAKRSRGPAAAKLPDPAGILRNPGDPVPRTGGGHLLATNRVKSVYGRVSRLLSRLLTLSGSTGAPVAPGQGPDGVAELRGARFMESFLGAHPARAGGVEGE